MDISRLVDFSGQKPVLKQGGWTPTLCPIAPPVKRKSWIRQVVDRLRKDHN